MENKDQKEEQIQQVQQVETQRTSQDPITSFFSSLSCDDLENCEYYQGARIFFNPFENLYSLRKDHDGRTMDYFGYLAHRLTEVKTQHVFSIPLEIRAPAVVIATLGGALSNFFIYQILLIIFEHITIFNLITFYHSSSYNIISYYKSI